MRIATYIPSLALALCALALGGCGSDRHPEQPPAGPLTVYLSLPREGASTRTADAVGAGVRLALADAHGRAGGRRVRIVELDSSRPGGQTWDPSTVEANAKRAADDPTTIAYIGELGNGASAISIPVTNDKGILQVSPLDGLTSLTRDEPGGSLATGPDRYYPSGRRTLLRLVPNDYLQATALVAWARGRGASRIATVQDQRLFGRELAKQVRYTAVRQTMTVVDAVEADDDPSSYSGLAQRLAEKHPDAVLYTGLGTPASGVLLAALRRAMPGVPLFGGSALAESQPALPGVPPVAVLKPAFPAAAYGPGAQRILDRLTRRRGAPTPVEALYGYEAMRVVLDALGATRSGDRAAVVQAALAPRTRRSVIGPYRVLPGGDVSTARFAGYRREEDSLTYTGQHTPLGGSP
jgi:branched-chain amino acid transport system substrate-binding protein